MFLAQNIEKLNNIQITRYEEDKYIWEESSILKGIRIEKTETLDQSALKMPSQRYKLFNPKLKGLSAKDIKKGAKLLTLKGYGKVQSIKGELVTLIDNNQNIIKSHVEDLSHIIKLEIQILNKEFPDYLSIKINIHKKVKELVQKISAIMNIGGQLYHKKVKLDHKSTFIEANILHEDKLIFASAPMFMYIQVKGLEFIRIGIYIYIYI